SDPGNVVVRPDRFGRVWRGEGLDVRHRADPPAKGGAARCRSSRPNATPEQRPRRSDTNVGPIRECLSSRGRHRSRRLRVLAAGVCGLRIGGPVVTVESDVWRGQRMKKVGTTTVRFETRTTIDRPIGEVFARLADLDGYRTWMHRTGLFRR